MRFLYSFFPKRPLMVFCACTLLFFLLAADIRYFGFSQKLDRAISEALHARGSEDVIFYQWATNLGGSLVKDFTYAAAGILVLCRRWMYLPALWAIVELGTSLAGKMQKFFARPRPYFPDLELLTNPGFPSGHTSGATLIFGFFFLLAIKELKSRELKVFCAGLAAGCILLVGYTRIALLVHHTTDVIGGMLWCTAWVIGWHYANIAAYRWSAPLLPRWASLPPES